MSTNRSTGTVKFFNEQKGYGFIHPAEGQDVFVHVTALQETGLQTLQEGQKVSFELKTDPRTNRTSAVSLKVE